MKEEISIGGVAMSEFGDVSNQGPPAQQEHKPDPIPEKPNPTTAKDSDGKKPSKLKSVSDAFANLMMSIGVFITGGIFGLIGFRRVSVKRLIIEAVIVGIIATVMYFTTTTWLHPYTEAVDLGDPLQRAVLFVVGAIILAYIGGMTVHIGWNRKGDPKVSMLILAVGMTLIGLRIASLTMAFGEIKTLDAKVETGSAGLKVLMATAELMRAEGIDPKPVGTLMKDFHDSIYSNKYVEAFYGITKGEKIVAPDVEFMMKSDTPVNTTEAPALPDEDIKPTGEPFGVETEPTLEKTVENGLHEVSPQIPPN